MPTVISGLPAGSDSSARGGAISVTVGGLPAGADSGGGGSPPPTYTALSSWSADQSGQCNLDIELSATLTVHPAVVVPPTGLTDVNLQRVSAVFPAPTLDSNSLPVDWVPTSTIEEDWGRYQIVVGEVDVTFFRGFATQLGDMSWAEPFGDDTADIIFPQISPWDELGTGDLAWCVPGANVEIYKVEPDGTVDVSNPMF